MAALQPYCRVINLATNVVVAATTSVLDFSFEQGLDRIGVFSCEIGAGDPGLAGRDDSTWKGFGEALLQASADLGNPPIPLLLEFSLDGGTYCDTRKFVDHPVRSLQAARRTIKEDGSDIASLLATVPVERATYTEIALQDIFNAAAGTIVPLISSGFLTLDGKIPYLAGVLTVKPGLTTWPSGSRDRLKFVGIFNPDIQNTPTNIDVDSATTLAVCETVVNRLAGAAPAQDFGHYVADCSDAALNLSGTTSWTPASPAPCANAFVVGHKGTSPYLTFDATSNTDVDETTTARVHLDASSVTTDDSTIFRSCDFVGGKSTAGWPTDGKVSGFAIINTQVAAGVGMSGTRDAWQDCLPLVGIDAGDNGGGIYFYAGDGTMRPMPGSPNARCLAIAYDQGDQSLGRPSSLFFASPHGIYWTTPVDFLGPTATWNLLGTTLNCEVTRIQLNVIPTGHVAAGKIAVWALIKGKSEQLDGVWRCNTDTQTWEQVLINGHVLDLCTTDFGTAWTIEQATQKRIHRYHYNDTTHKVVQTPKGGYLLPSGQAFSLQRVPTAEYLGSAGPPSQPAVPAKDSIWALTVGGTSPAYYLVNDVTNTWADTTFKNSDVDGTLKNIATGQHLQAYKAGGLGFTVEDQYVSVLLGTNQGLYWSKQPLGGGLDWHSCNELGGLGGFEVRNAGLGDYQYILGQKINRMFIVTDSDLLVSNSTGRWWQPVRERDRTTMGPHLSQINLSLHGDLPSNKVRTWGTTNADGTLMDSSPITGAASGSHIHIPPGNADEVPKGFYFERFLNSHLNFEYRFVSQACPFMGQQMSQLPDIQTNTSVEPDRAGKAVMLVAKRWLQQHATAQSLITLESSFSSVESRLRSLRPSHKVALKGQIVVRDISARGAQTSARVLDFSGDEDLWVLGHTIRKGPGNTTITTTTIAPELRQTPTSEQDMMQALPDAIHNIKVWR